MCVDQAFGQAIFNHEIVSYQDDSILSWHLNLPHYVPPHLKFEGIIESHQSGSKWKGIAKFTNLLNC